VKGIGSNRLFTKPYLLTPEHRAVSRVLRAAGKCDFDKASRVLEAYEKWPLVKFHATRSVIEIIRYVFRADLLFASLFLFLLLLPGHETVLDRLSFLDKHRAWKSVFSCFVFGLCVVAVTWKVWAEWREFEIERARYDVESILKKRGRASFERLSRMGPRYAPEFLNKLIRTYPMVFRRTTIKKKKKPAIILVS
jgi:hypothetical protein